MGDAEAPLLLAAQALLLEARGRDLIVFNPGVRRHGCALHAQGCRSDAGLRVGSTYLRVGRASDAAPVEVPHVVAFPRRGAAACPPAPPPPPPQPFVPDAEREAACRQARGVARGPRGTR